MGFDLMIDYELVFGGIITAVAIAREIQHRNMKAQFLKAVTASSDELAFIYDRAKSGDLCTRGVADQIATKTVIVWGIWESLGSTFAEVLGQKTSLAKTLKPVEEVSK